MNRKGYNKLQQDAKKDLNEAIQRFAELNPERFAELQKRAKREINEPTPIPVKRYMPPNTRTLTVEDIDKMIYDPNERHYFVQAADKWGSEHLFCASLNPQKVNNETILGYLMEKHPKYYPDKILQTTPCNCPACIKRHGEIFLS